MKFLVLVFLILFPLAQVFGISLNCQFEEVYSNSDTQKGQILINENNLRYEYFREDLFTILYVNKKIFQIDNKDKDIGHLISDQNNIIPELMEVYSDYPNFNNNYKKNGYEIFVELSNDKFIKRLIIKSSRLNVSIYFFDCEEVDLKKELFNFNPFIEYVRNKN